MKVAKSYKDYNFDLNKAYKNNKGKLVVDATCKCDRCGGSGKAIARVVNGIPIPFPNDGGVCYKCDGTGYIKKTIRVYTEEEFEKIEKTQSKRAEERAAALEEKYEQKKEQWFIRNGFNEEKITYIYFPLDSYDIKEELKAAGFKYNPILLWHAAEVPDEYSDKCILVSFDEVAEMDIFGAGAYKVEAKSLVEEKLKEARPASKSKWIGEEKEKIAELPVILASIRTFEGYYGQSQIIKFLNEDNVIIWFTATNIKFEIGDSLLLSGTIKKLETYKDRAQTVMTRCQLKPAN